MTERQFEKDMESPNPLAAFDRQFQREWASLCSPVADYFLTIVLAVGIFGALWLMGWLG